MTDAAGAGAARPGKRVRFGPYTLEVAQRRVLRAGEEIALSPRLFDLLSVLVAAGGAAVSKRQLFDTVWPRMSVGDQTLTQSIWMLRRALGDADGSIIRTLPRHGYAINVAVAEEGADPAPDSPEGGAPEPAAVGAGSAPIARNADVVVSSAPAVPAWRHAGPVALLVLVVAGLVAWAIRAPDDEPPPRVLVADIITREVTSQAGESTSDVLFEELVAAELVRLAGVAVVPRARASVARVDLGLAPGDRSEDALFRIARAAGASVVVSGTVHDGRSADLVLRDARNGALLSSVSVPRADGVGGLASTAALAIATRLPRVLARPRDADGGWVVPDDPVAREAFLQGTRLSETGQYLEAAEAFKRCIAKAPGFGLARLRLAEVYEVLGQPQARREQLAAALAAEHGMPRDQRAAARASLAEIEGRRDDAKRELEALVQLYPDVMDYVKRLAILRSRDGDARGAMALLDLAAAQATSDVDRFALALARADLLLDTGDAAAAATAATEALHAAERAGAQTGVVEALLLRANAAVDRGAPAEARSDLARARGVLDRVQAPMLATAWALEHAELLVAEGQAPEGIRIASDALDDAVQGGWVGLEIQALLVRAEALTANGDSKAAIADAEAALAAAERAGDRSRIIMVATNLGANLIAAAELPRARAVVGTGISAADAEGDDYNSAIGYMNMASIEAMSGNPAAAADSMTLGLALAERAGWNRGALHAATWLVDLQASLLQRDALQGTCRFLGSRAETNDDAGVRVAHAVCTARVFEIDGDYIAARDTVDRALVADGEHLPLDERFLRYRYAAELAYWSGADAVDLARRAEALAQRADPPPVPVAGELLAQLQAMAALRAGDPDLAEAAIDRVGTPIDAENRLLERILLAEAMYLRGAANAAATAAEAVERDAEAAGQRLLARVARKVRCKVRRDGTGC